MRILLQKLVVSFCAFFCIIFSVFSQGLPLPLNNKTWSHNLNGETISVEWVEDVPSGDSSFTILGKIKGDSESEVIYSKVEGAVGILIKSTFTEIKEITYTEENGINFAVYSPSDFPDHNTWKCSEHHDHTLANEHKITEKKGSIKKLRRAETPAIDLLVLYTTESKNQRGGKAQMESFINGFVASCNATINRSNANAKVVLLEARETNYRAHGVLNTDFFRLVNKTDGHLDEVHDLRAELGADLVLLLTDKDNNGTFGIASIPSGTTGNRNSAFSVCRTATAAGVYPHEIGHNLGCNHNRNRPSTTTFPYSFGHFWENNGETRGSIMSYTGRRSAYFSNPDVRLDGSPTGRNNLNDNARTIDNLAPYISAYYDRPSTITPTTGPEGYTYAVDENQTIDVTYKIDVAYGANDQWIYLPNQTTDITCTNEVFGGDPISGVAKKCYIKESKGPYFLSPASIPGIIELENYDRGGDNVSYHDNDQENKGADRTDYRINDGVDIGLAGNGKAIGWTAIGEWTNYTVDILEAGVYDLELTYSSLPGGAEISLSIENAGSLGDKLFFPTTGSWTNYETRTSQVTLPSGLHTIQVKVEKNGLNMDKMVFTKSTVTSINDHINEEVNIFPNPSNSGVFSLSKEMEWSVVNLRGRTIASGAGKTVDLSSTEQGTYLFKTKNVIRKIVLE